MGLLLAFLLFARVRCEELSAQCDLIYWDMFSEEVICIKVNNKNAVEAQELME